ncbi:peptidylprolyl isomerase [Nostoc sp. FACHB-152]|uniref:peptidylprolyl isomerase n=1 Tax=unclassified Nostoc TaxID=2593658 RepID=UPI00168469D9|nr:MULTISPECIES: peptidylprolyl isomerase [unclassified Nostoc]MBD2450313.1 peptidylprolyl isomerase [Nostoc sp. FACHB-152]MBD2471783.1 peptidylprolyl isomerase [Nostoc sp. FACHB-145]
MTEILEKNANLLNVGNPYKEVAAELDSTEKFVLPEISLATNEEIIAYLRHSYKIAEIAVLAERDELVLSMCEQFDITISDEELQAAGDTFRLEHKLLGASETLAWLQKQRITVEDWTQGIRMSLLTNKLKEHLFGDSVDSHYLSNRNHYKRVALSQILVSNLTDALKIIHVIREENASFCALALEHSKGKHSKENGGFVGIRFVSELMPEIVQAIAQAKEGEVIEPVQTKLGYHILRIEKWFPAELNEIREQILELLFQAWIKAESISVYHTERHQ